MKELIITEIVVFNVSRAFFGKVVWTKCFTRVEVLPTSQGWCPCPENDPMRTQPRWGGLPPPFYRFSHKVMRASIEMREVWLRLL